MRLTHLKISNYLGARSVDVRLDNPVTLFCGANGAGKSSILEAVRHAMTGESTRVGLKKDFNSLITEGQEVGLVEIENAIQEGVAASVVLPSGKGIHDSNRFLPYVLDFHRFSRLNNSDRRAFLFDLMQVRTTGKEILARMLERGCDEHKAGEIAPLLSAGFDAAAKEAQAKAREQKAVWRNLTGETWGEKKAPGWRAAIADGTGISVEAAESAISDLDKRIDAANQDLGSLKAQAQSVGAVRAKLAEATDKAGRYARIQDKLNRDEKELAEWKIKVEATKAAASGANVEGHHECPHCDGLVQIKGEGLFAKLVKYVMPEKSPDADAIARLPEYERAMITMERSVQAGKRDLDEADAAARSIAELEKQIGEAPADTLLLAAAAKVDEIKSERTKLIKELEEEKRIVRLNLAAAQKSADALAAHGHIMDWEKIAEALAPSGIQGDLLGEALAPINARMTECPLTGPGTHVLITTDMDILLHDIRRGGRRYEMLSESEQWRVDAAITEAISSLSGLRMLGLDRADVLDLPGRGALFQWLGDLIDTTEIDTAMVFATLKAAPDLGDGFGVFWIDGGTVLHNAPGKPPAANEPTEGEKD